MANCYHHPSREAVAQCKGCGKAICRECAEMYGVSTGEYAGCNLCYDCTVHLVEQNVNYVKVIKGTAIKELCLLPFLMLWNMLKGLFTSFQGGSEAATSGGGVIKIFIGLFRFFWAPIKTIFDVIVRFVRLSKANKIIASDTQYLQELRDYFAYTQVMEKKADSFDLSKLADQGGELFENTYARSVLENGEKNAQAELRKGVVQIAANGEILRGYTGEKPKKAA